MKWLLNLKWGYPIRVELHLQLWGHSLSLCVLPTGWIKTQSGLPFSPPPPPKHSGWPSSSHAVKMVDGCSAWFTSCIFRLLVYFDVGREEINKQKNSGHRSGSTQDLWQREQTYLSNQIKEWTQLAVPMAATLLRTEERLWLLIFSQHILPNW